MSWWRTVWCWFWHVWIGHSKTFGGCVSIGAFPRLAGWQAGWLAGCLSLALAGNQQEHQQLANCQLNVCRINKMHKCLPRVKYNFSFLRTTDSNRLKSHRLNRFPLRNKYLKIRTQVSAPQTSSEDAYFNPPSSCSSQYVYDTFPVCTFPSW